MRPKSALSRIGLSSFAAVALVEIVGASAYTISLMTTTTMQTTTSSSATISVSSATAPDSGLPQLETANPADYFGYPFDSNPNDGWLIPANEWLSTTYDTNLTAIGPITGTFTIFPCQVPKNTWIQLALYIDGVFCANQTYD